MVDHDRGRPTPIDQAQQPALRGWRFLVTFVLLGGVMVFAWWVRTGDPDGGHAASLGLAIAVIVLGAACLVRGAGPRRWHDADRAAAQRAELPSQRVGASWSVRTSRLFYLVAGSAIVVVGILGVLDALDSTG